MSELKFGIIGASGKVGKEITALLIEKKLIPFLGIYGSNEPTNFTHKAKEIDVNLAKQVDLWIDFSLPESFERFIPIASKLGKPVVSGTTGLSDKQKIILRDASNHCPILWSANMIHIE